VYYHHCGYAELGMRHRIYGRDFVFCYISLIVFVCITLVLAVYCCFVCVVVCSIAHVARSFITINISQPKTMPQTPPAPLTHPQYPPSSISKPRNTGRSLRCWRSFSCQVSEYRANCFGTILICLVEAWKVKSTSHVTRSPPSLLPFICSS
jgi:hypothetical protein